MMALKFKLTNKPNSVVYICQVATIPRHTVVFKTRRQARELKRLYADSEGQVLVEIVKRVSDGGYEYEEAVR